MESRSPDAAFVEESHECDHKWRDYSEFGGDFEQHPVVCRDCGAVAPPDVTRSVHLSQPDPLGTHTGRR